MVEPVVDLNLGPQAPQPQGSSNPLGLAQGLAGLQSTLQANQLFRQQWQARQLAGDTLAASPDLDTAVKRMQSNPTIMGWFPEITTQLIQNQIGNQTLAKLKLDTSQSALSAIYSGLAPTQSDPTLYDKSMKLAINGLTPDVRKQVQPAIDSMNSILSPLAKSDPDGYRRTLAALQLTTLGPDRVMAMSGHVPPTLAQSAGGGLYPAGGLPGAVPSTPSPTPPSVQGSVSYTGRPLTPDPSNFVKSPLGPGNQPIRDPTQQTQVNQASERFHSAQPQYDAASNSIATLESAQDELRTLARGGGFQSPGALGNLRAQLAKGVNTLWNVVEPGKEPPFDLTKQSAADALIKNSGQMAFQLVHSMMGSHSGIGALQEAFTSIPGIENSPLGGMIVSETLKAASAWKRDQGTFIQNWANQNGGDIRNAEETFRREFPPSDYIGKVMTQYGLGPKGFTDESSIGNAYRDQLITKDQALAFRRKLKGGGNE